MTRGATALFGAVLALGSGACGGVAMGDFDAQVCPNGFDEMHIRTIAEGLQEWHNRSGGRVNMRIANEPGCIPVRPRSGAEPYGRYDFRAGVLELDPVEDLDAFRTLVEHEVGHFLTGLKHSADPRDVMFPRSMPGVLHLTDADIERLDYPGEWR